MQFSLQKFFTLVNEAQRFCRQQVNWIAVVNSSKLDHELLIIALYNVQYHLYGIYTHIELFKTKLTYPNCPWEKFLSYNAIVHLISSLK